MQNLPPQVNVDISQAKDIVCDKCGNATFQPVVLLKLVPAVLVGAPKDAIAPINTFACNACGWVNAALLPKQAKQESTTSSLLIKS